MKIKKKYYDYILLLSLRILTVLVIFTMLFSFVACAKDDNQNGGNDVENAGSNNGDNSAIIKETQGERIIEETTDIQSPIPKDVTFGGNEMRILNCTYYPEELIFVNTEEETGDIVNDAVYRRNLKVQSDLDVNFKFIDVSLVNGDNFQKMVKNSVSSGSDDYDILFGVQYDCVQMATSNVFTNLINAPYINLDNPWWAAKRIQEELTIGKDNLYFLTGDISLNFVRNMGCAYFNKQLYSEYFGNPDDMYKTVLEGKWTMDKLGEMAKVMYKDLNGDGKADDNDQYGCGVITSNLTDHFTYASGVRVTARDDQGVPYLVMNNERTSNFADKLYNLYYTNEGVRIFPPTEETNQITIPAKFMNNELLFDFGWFYISELLRDMKADYGIIGAGETETPKLVEDILKGKAAEQIYVSKNISYIEPDIDEKLLQKYLNAGGIIGVNTKRGCAYSCGYCSYPLIDGKTFSGFDAKATVSYIKRLENKYGVKEIFFTDSVFNDASGFSQALCEEMIKQKTKLRFAAYFNPANIYRADMELFKRAGLFAVECGADAASDAALKALDKPFNFKQVEDLQDMCDALKIPCAHFVIFGGPGETEGSVEEGLENLKKLENGVVMVFSGIRVHYGTRIYETALAEGKIDKHTSLLKPFYYFSDKINVDKMNKKIELSFKGNRKRIFPPEKGEEMMKTLRRFGYGGLLWDTLVKYE